MTRENNLVPLVTLLGQQIGHVSSHVKHSLRSAMTVTICLSRERRFYYCLFDVVVGFKQLEVLQKA